MINDFLEVLNFNWLFLQIELAFLTTLVIPVSGGGLIVSVVLVKVTPKDLGISVHLALFIEITIHRNTIH